MPHSHPELSQWHHPLLHYTVITVAEGALASQQEPYWMVCSQWHHAAASTSIIMGGLTQNKSSDLIPVHPSTPNLSVRLLLCSWWRDVCITEQSAVCSSTDWFVCVSPLSFCGDKSPANVCVFCFVVVFFLRLPCYWQFPHFAHFKTYMFYSWFQNSLSRLIIFSPTITVLSPLFQKKTLCFSSLLLYRTFYSFQKGNKNKTHNGRKGVVFQIYSKDFVGP